MKLFIVVKVYGHERSTDFIVFFNGPKTDKFRLEHWLETKKYDFHAMLCFYVTNLETT